MIKDKLSNNTTFYSLSERFKQGFEWLKNNDLASIPDGKYYIDDEKIYVNIQTYETKDDALYEAHRNYADIQYMIKGSEKIGVTDYSNCETEIEYDVDKDIEFLNCIKDDFYQNIKEGEFLVLFPQDAHKPSINPDKKITVKKAVVKVLIV